MSHGPDDSLKSIDDGVPPMEPVPTLTTAEVFKEYGEYIDEIGGVQNAQHGDLDNLLLALKLAEVDEDAQESSEK